jgi:hypothetical protein
LSDEGRARRRDVFVITLLTFSEVKPVERRSESTVFL